MSAIQAAGQSEARDWHPHVTVAAIVEREGRFLLVEEETDEGIRLNQPAGHLDAGESLVQACVREALEETAHHVQVEALVGVYHWTRQRGDLTYLRFAFAASVVGHEPARSLDQGILRAVWLSRDELLASRAMHRSPLVLQCVEDYRSGRRTPLDLLHYND